MKLTNKERDQLRQKFLMDEDINLDRLIVLTEQALAQKFYEEIEKAKNEISNLIQENTASKQIEDLINKKLLSDSNFVKQI